MEERIEVIEGYFVNKLDFIAWIDILSKNPERAKSLNPDLFQAVKIGILNRPIQIAKEILNLPETFAAVLKKLKDEDEIIQIEKLRFHVKLLQDYIYGTLLIKNEYSPDFEQVRPPLIKLLKKFELLLSQLTLKQNENVVASQSDENVVASQSDENVVASQEQNHIEIETGRSSTPRTPVSTTVRYTVKLSAIAKAVYHHNLTEKFKPKLIAEWLLKHCDVVKADGNPATLKSLAKQITTTKTDRTKQGRKFKLFDEIEILKQLPELE